VAPPLPPKKFEVHVTGMSHGHGPQKFGPVILRCVLPPTLIEEEEKTSWVEYAATILQMEKNTAPVEDSTKKCRANVSQPTLRHTPTYATNQIIKNVVGRSHPSSFNTREPPTLDSTRT